MRQDGSTAAAGDPEGWRPRMPGRPATSSGKTYIDQGGVQLASPSPRSRPEAQGTQAHGSDLL